MKTSEIFKAAKKHLWSGAGELNGQSKERYICHAIYWRVTGCSIDKVHHAKKIIALLLEGHYTLDDWLWANHKINGGDDRRKLQRTRQAWLDHLIAHYESIGD